MENHGTIKMFRLDIIGGGMLYDGKRISEKKRL